MGVIVTIAVVFFVPICIVLTLIILLQDSKGEGLSSSAFGGSGMESVLGGHGAASFLSKLTTWVAIGFMVISLFLMRFYGESVDRSFTPLDQGETEQTQQVEEGQETLEEDSKGIITPTEEASEETTQETTEEDTKGDITTQEDPE